jgi:hypothetical protein
MGEISAAVRKAVIVACAGVSLAACSAKTTGSLGTTGPGAAPAGGTSDSPTIKARFVNALGPGKGQLDVVADSSDPAKKKVLAADIKPGAVTDYLTIPISATMTVGGQPAPWTNFALPKDPNSRVTVLVDDQFEAFVEKDGKLTGEAWGTTGQSQPPQLASGKALLVARWQRPDLQPADNFELSKPGAGCLPGGPHDQQGGPGPVLFYQVSAGPQELAYSDYLNCKRPSTATAKFTVESGQSAYTVVYLSDPKHARMLVVPITADKPGNTGVVDSGDGPAFTNHSGVTYVDGDAPGDGNNTPDPTAPEPTGSATPEPTDSSTPEPPTTTSDAG